MPERRSPVPTPPVLQKVLVVDDEENWTFTLAERLKEQGYHVTTADDGTKALTVLDKESFDVILADVKMPKMDGWALLDTLRERRDPAVVIMMSGYGDHDTAVQVMKRGAYDFTFKPDMEDILLTLQKAEEREKLRRENIRLREEIKGEYNFDNIIAQSPKMLEIFAIIRKISEYKTTVLISGESGTGKELVARALHFNSPRRDNPFIALNCGAIPENLIESELFGHVKGAFTDAVRDKKGLFELAHTGTLFLDEIGELPLALQVRLLRALQEEEIRRIGADTSIKVDVRIVAATAKDLAKEVREGRFRDDLYYRLNVLAIHPPPLRDRREDIPLLVDSFLEKHSSKLNLPLRKINKAAMKFLLDYHWPGNVRELENVIERAVILSEGEITPEHLPQSVLTPTASMNEPDDVTGDKPLSLKPRVRQLEENLIRRALELCNANRTRAAKLLDVSHRTLLYKMHEYGIK